MAVRDRFRARWVILLTGSVCALVVAITSGPSVVDYARVGLSGLGIGAARPALALAPTPVPVPTPVPTVPDVSRYQAIGRRPPPPPPLIPGPSGFVSETNSAAVALTFDDGPSPIWTPRILAVLRESGAKATFCLVGTMVVRYPQLVRAIVAAGHTLCDHSWNHNMKLGKLSRDAIRDDLRRTNAAIRAAAPGARIPYFRQPGGFWTQSVISVARELGMTSLGWTADTRDWTRPPVVRLANAVTKACHPGVIILMHDGGGVRSATFEALRRVLPVLVRSFTFAALTTAVGL